MSSIFAIFRLRPWIIPFGLIVLLFFLVATFAPLLAFGMPLVVYFENELYFPLFRYLLYKEVFSKPIDLFFNFWMLAWPLTALAWYFQSKLFRLCVYLVFFAGLFWVLEGGIRNPANMNETLLEEGLGKEPTWRSHLAKMNGYARLKLVWGEYREWKTSLSMKPYLPSTASTPYAIEQARYRDLIRNLPFENPHRQYLIEREAWIQEAFKDLKWTLEPLMSSYFWEESTGIDQSLNRELPWKMRARVNRKDLLSGIIYGSRISFVVGVLAVLMSLTIGIPFGAISAYFSGYLDVFFMRFIEIWEALPTFFMLLFITSIMQSKSILLVVVVLGIFNWTGFARFVRAEVLKQKQLPYIDAAKSQGLSHTRILFSQIIPNSISPILTLLPFAVMNAISSEAGLSFLGLGEEGSCSWGTLMDEGRISFPSESYLLWPPAGILSLVLISIAVIGDSLRDWLDPKLKE
jgi:peptide/nickel transport system permease protein